VHLIGRQRVNSLLQLLDDITDAGCRLAGAAIMRHRAESFIMRVRRNDHR
jgi:hypothetical protein